MCGLTAFISKYSNGFTADEALAFRGMLWLTQLRGEDSTGVVQLTNKFEVDSLKRLGPPQELYQTHEWAAWNEKLIADGRLAYGHCRAATKGTVTEANAHPFYLPRNENTGITLVHNGTLPWQSTFEDYSKFDVDSKWMAHHLCIEGPEEVFSKIEGPIATMWYDSGDQTFNVFRNSERPLFYVETVDRNILINSERETLLWAIARYGLKPGKNDIKIFPTMEWFQYSGPDFNDPKVKKINRRSTKRYQYVPSSHVWTRDKDGEWVQMGVDEEEREKPLWSLQRTFNDDLEHIFKKRIKKVRFEERFNQWVRVTTDKDNYETTHWNIVPYEPGIRDMTLDPVDDNFILVSQVKEGGDLVVRRFRKRQEPVIEGEIVSPEATPAVARRRGPLAIDSLKYRKGKRLHWSHKLPGGDRVKHTAICSEEQPQWFSYYENNKDGAIKAGDHVYMEMFEVEEGQAVRTVYGFRMHAQDLQDMCIECIFHTPNHSKKEIESFEFWEGEVAFIRITDRQRYIVSGNIVQVILKNVKPVTQQQMKGTNNVAQAYLQ